MAPRRSRASTPRTAMPWAVAAAAALTIVSAPFGTLAPRCAEAFLPPSVVTGAHGYSAATKVLAASKAAGFARHPAATPAALNSSGRLGDGALRLRALGVVGGDTGNGDGGDDSWAQRRSHAARSGSGGGAGARRRLEVVSGGGRWRKSLASPLSSTPEGGGVGDAGGVRRDEQLPEDFSMLSAGSGVQGDDEEGGEGEEGEEEMDETWSDAEVERKVEERKASKVDPYAEAAAEEEEEDEDAEVYEEIIANMTKPLGITIEASTDQAALIYITSVGQQAEEAGLEVGDVVTGVSAVFGDDIWSVKGKTVEKVRSLVRCRTEPYILVRAERGHVTLEERCSEGFGIVQHADCWRLTDSEDCDVDYTNLWANVYKEEMEVLSGGADGAGGGGAEEPKRRNEPPPPRDSPGMGSFGEDLWGGSDF